MNSDVESMTCQIVPSAAFKLMIKYAVLYIYAKHRDNISKITYNILGYANYILISHEY